MARFRIEGQNADGERKTFIYDNMTSELRNTDGSLYPVDPYVPMDYRAAAAAVVVAPDQPGMKRAIATLKIQLGLLCNYECGYCNQRYVPHTTQTNPDDIEQFLAMLRKADTGAIQQIEFWGGEPLVYWKTLKPLSAKLRVMFPRAEFVIITNGSLLDEEKNTWLDAMGFHVAISHDGPAQSARGPDPLDDDKSRAGIMDLYRRLHPLGRISINTMIHRENQSRELVAQFHQKTFGADVVVGEGAVIDPYDEGGLAASFQDPHEHIMFRRKAYDELVMGHAIGRMTVVQRVKDIIDSIANQRPAHVLGQKCGMDRADNLAVDLNGNVLTCQNVTAAAKKEDGTPHKLGRLDDLNAARLTTSTHWSKRSECSNCPVLQSCKGSCMFLEGKLWEAGCDNAFSDHLPFFAAAFSLMTGFMPRYIEGPQREDRKDVLGLVGGVPKRKVFPIIRQ